MLLPIAALRRRLRSAEVVRNLGIVLVGNLAGAVVVAMGFDHVVANMFFLPAAMFAGVPGLTWIDVTVNLGIATIGNLVGGAVFVALAYWYVYLKDEPENV